MTWWKRRGERLHDEMQRHIDFETQENVERGMSPEEARSAALRKFGSVTLAREESREIWGWLWAERLWQDLRYALRGFGRSPGFTVVALVSLMLGIGASTALFSVVYGVLIAPYPYAKPDEIWAPAVTGMKEPPNGWHSYPIREFLEIQKLPAFADVMATGYEPVVVTGDRAPERFYGVLLTGGAFHFIGVKPLIGRTIQPFDIGTGGEPAPVVVLSYGFWQRVFNGDPKAIGQKLILNKAPHTIIGVMPPRFGWYTNESFWLPMPMNLADETPVNVIMRLRPGITKQVAEQQLQELNLRLAAANPNEFAEGKLRTVLLNYMDITVASGEMSSSLHLLLIAVGMLLLIACVNVANLQLARTTSRAREIAVRLSIGAGRKRLVRQLLTESLLLSLLGGAAGVLFAVVATHAIAGLIPGDYVPNEARINVNGYVLFFSFVVSVLTGIAFGLTPAIQCSKPDLADSLKDGGRGSVGSVKGQAARGWLVVAEIGLSVVLLAGATLAIRGFADLLQTDPGFQPQRTLMMEVPLPAERYTTLEQRNTFDRNLLESVRRLPGVKAAAIGNGGMPFGGGRSAYSIQGQLPSDDRRVLVGLISAEYLQTLGIPLKSGRELTEDEVIHGEHFALINEAARKLWPAGEDPIGKRISLDILTHVPPNVLLPAGARPDVTVVGVTGNTRNAGLRDAVLPAVLVPYTLLAPPSRMLAVRTYGEPMTILNAVRKTIQQMDKELWFGRPQTLTEILGYQTVEPRFNMALFSCFAALGLALAGVGIYSVISYDVTQRMHEIGVRVALGATRADVLRLVLRTAAKLAAIGLAIGLCGSVVVERIVRFQVFAATAFDARSMGAVVVTLAVVALAATWWPARRAAKLDPVAALRHEA